MTEYPMSISIEADGSPLGTTIKTTEGQTLRGVKSVHFEHTHSGEIPVAILEFYCAGLTAHEISAMVPFDEILEISQAHGFRLIPDSNLKQEIEFVQLQKLARSHGYILIKDDAQSGFVEGS